MNDLKNELVGTQTRYLAARPLYERIISNQVDPQSRYQNNSESLKCFHAYLLT